ncbi:hypothetical protein BDZ97DRAFT_1918647 [Flammula alnicola]|nr:hypothetical protein BDZ97DRAFT_1918647 [Flammula alnicola]
MQEMTGSGYDDRVMRAVMAHLYVVIPNDLPAHTVWTARCEGSIWRIYPPSYLPDCPGFSADRSKISRLHWLPTNSVPYHAWLKDADRWTKFGQIRFKRPHEFPWWEPNGPLFTSSTVPWWHTRRYGPGVRTRTTVVPQNFFGFSSTLQSSRGSRHSRKWRRIHQARNLGFPAPSTTLRDDLRINSNPTLPSTEMAHLFIALLLRLPLDLSSIYNHNTLVIC